MWRPSAWTAAAWCATGARSGSEPGRSRVLVYLHEHHGRLVTKEDLFRAVWPGTFVSDDSLTKCVREIRQALWGRPRATRC